MLVAGYQLFRDSSKKALKTNKSIVYDIDSALKWAARHWARGNVRQYRSSSVGMEIAEVIV
jgi:hypothetical protein